ncbi:hypothetical protein P23_2772 [Acinetobacter calcoaceticus]|uniref:hypothetical protein n=2 Tax=Acinetobacter calcoaceticus/baumannii complex TaxID=909768 RepID=UPI000582F970|nr:hypothetical protein [Acinetobacter calcoaceticus]GAM32248.1 hypothetical protein P23_2772 [Acinetobacter calcoaceticus]
MIFSEENRNKFTYLKDYATLINEAYINLQPYYFDPSKEKYHPFAESIFYQIRDQFVILDHKISNFNITKGYLEVLIKEYSNSLNDIILNASSNEERIVNIFKNIYMFLKNFTDNNADRSFSLYIPSLVNSEAFNRLVTDLKTAIYELDKNNIHNINDFQDKVIALEERILKLNADFKFGANKIDESINSFLKVQKDNFNNEAENILLDLKKNINNVKSTLDNDIVKDLDSLKERFNQEAQGLEELKKEALGYKEAISIKMEGEFSKFYIKKAKEEKSLYYIMTGVSFIVILSSLRLAWLSLKKYYKNYVDPIGLKETIKGLSDKEIEWVQQTAFLYLSLRLIISILLFLTVIYTGRIAYRSYLHWRHSENTYLKLSSLRPFISDLPSDIKIQIRRDLVPDFFGKDAGNIDDTSGNFKDLPTNVSALAVKAIEQVGNNLSGKSNTEKNDKKAEDPQK